MPKTIEPKLRKIGDYLHLEEDAIFSIPEYQRAYSWQIDNCDKLWQDIMDFIESGSKDRYFFGTIIINCQDDDQKLVLIDGQQRTTTFLLLLKALLIRIIKAIKATSNDEESRELCNGLKTRRRTIMSILYKAEEIDDEPDEETDNEIYKHTKIMENLSINERYPNELSIILGAVDYKEAADKVTQIKYRQKDNRYTNFFRNFKFFCEKIDELSESELNNFAKAVTQECEVIEIRSWQVEQAIMMFNSLNSDGMPLCDSDIISAKLYASADRKGEIAEFNALWKQLAENVEKLMETNVATLDGILMQQMYYVRAVNRETISDSGYIIVTTPGLRRYYTEINKKLLDNPNDLCREMIHLTEAWAKVADCPLVKLLLKFNYNSRLFMASYFHRLALDEITDGNIAVVAESMLRLFTVLELVDTGFSSAKFKTFPFKENVQIADKSVSVGEIKKNFDEHIAANWTREAIRDAVMSYDGYTLVYLNEYLFAKERGMEFKMGSKCDIEHIMPSSGNNLDAIREDAGFSDKDEFKGFVNKIGNKILLEERINRAIGNEWFRVKVSTKLSDRTGYIDSDYPIAKYLVEKYRSKAKPFWKKKDIQAATKEASERIVRFVFGE